MSDVHENLFSKNLNQILCKASVDENQSQMVDNKAKPQNVSNANVSATVQSSKNKKDTVSLGNSVHKISPENLIKAKEGKDHITMVHEKQKTTNASTVNWLRTIARDQDVQYCSPPITCMK